MKAIIVEDEQLAISELTAGLREVAPDIEVVSVVRTVHDAISVIKTTVHDLIFMDIHLGDGSSFEIFNSIEIKAPVIFITAYDTYALNAFKNNGVDYLLKPFSPEDLRRAINKLDMLHSRQKTEEMPQCFQTRFLVSSGAVMKSVKVDEIAYFMADGKYLHIITYDGKDYIIDQTIVGVEERLCPSDFFKINRKFIVSFKAIEQMIKYSGSRIKLVLKPLPPLDMDSIVSTERVQEFRQWLNQ